MATKKKEKENLREMSREDLVKKLNSLKETLRIKRFKVEGGKAGNVKEARTLRRQIARVLTEINKKK